MLFRDCSRFISLDDKHKIKVGEPKCPVASAVRGRRVHVRSDEFFTVMDHDFTKFGIVPSVTLYIRPIIPHLFVPSVDLDYLCACRAAPYNSWRNPVERIMSVVNL